MCLKLKVTEDRSEVIGISDLVPMFASNTVTVYREEEAYSLLSLVSDCGGLLGLFIGFNFLMLWDSVVWALKKIRVKLCGGGSVLRCIDKCFLPIGCIKILEN